MWILLSCCILFSARTRRFVNALIAAQTGSGFRLCTSKSGSFVHVRRLVVCARFCCMFLSLYLCNMILLLVFFNISRVAFVCHLVELLSCSLTEVHPSSFTELISQLTQLISHNSTHLTTHRTHLTPLRSSYNSHNSSHLTSHTTHLTQLISHNSSYTTQLTQELLSCAIWWAAFVFSHWSSPKFFHRTHLTTHTTHLTQLHSSHNSQNSSHTTPLILQLTQLLSHLTSHNTHLTQLISHNSSYTTQLTQELLSCAIWWSCFRVLSLKFTQVLSQNSSHNSHNSSHTTPLISQVTELVSHHSTHLTTHNTRLISQVTQLISHNSSLTNSSYTTQLTQELLSCAIWWSCFRVLSLKFTKFFHTTHLNMKEQCEEMLYSKKMMRLLCVCRHRNMNLINSPHPTGNWSWKSCACLCSTGRKMMRLLCLCVHRNMNVIIPPTPPHPTPPHPTHPTPPPHPPTPRVTDHERAVRVSALQQERWWGGCASVCIGTWTLLTHPTPPVTHHERAVPVLLLYGKKDDEVAVPVCA